jgi:hypothetical protein
MFCIPVWMPLPANLTMTVAMTRPPSLRIC